MHGGIHIHTLTYQICVQGSMKQDWAATYKTGQDGTRQTGQRQADQRKQTDKQTDGQTDKPTDKQTDRQNDRADKTQKHKQTDTERQDTQDRTGHDGAGQNRTGQDRRIDRQRKNRTDMPMIDSGICEKNARSTNRILREQQPRSPHVQC